MASHFRCTFPLLLIYLIANHSYSQTVSGSSFFTYSKQTIVKDAEHIFWLGFNLIQTPFHFDGYDWLYIAGAGAVTSSSFLMDPSIREFARSNQTSFNDNFFKADKYFEGTNTSYAGAGLYLAGFIFKEEKIRMMGLNAISSLFIASTITSSLKYIFGRGRPYLNKDPINFKIFRGTQGKYRSFPSGHTTTAFAFGSVMAMSVDNIYWKSIWYTGAAMVAFSRIYHNLHWFSDNILAAVISYNVADYVVHYKKNSPSKNYSIRPSINGLNVIFYF